MTSKKLEIIAEPGKTSFTTTRVVDAPRALVFEAFTKREHLKRWMGPRNLTMVGCDSDFRVGRTLSLRAPRGERTGGRLQRRVPGDRTTRADRQNVRLRSLSRRRGGRDPRARGTERPDDDHDDDRSQDGGEPRRTLNSGMEAGMTEGVRSGSKSCSRICCRNGDGRARILPPSTCARVRRNGCAPLSPATAP